MSALCWKPRVPLSSSLKTLTYLPVLKSWSSPNQLNFCMFLPCSKYSSQSPALRERLPGDMWHRVCHLLNVSGPCLPTSQAAPGWNSS